VEINEERKNNSKNHKIYSCFSANLSPNLTLRVVFLASQSSTAVQSTLYLTVMLKTWVKYKNEIGEIQYEVCVCTCVVYPIYICPICVCVNVKLKTTK